MALCHNCDTARDTYTGNGVQKEYLITFEYYTRDDVAVAFFDASLASWVKIPNADWTFQHDTLIRFNDPPAFNQEFIIYRCTDLVSLPAEFFPGHSIKAEDLNNNFFVIKSAVEEVRCYTERYSNTSDLKYWSKIDSTITEAQQKAGQAEALLNSSHIFDAAAIAARHDAYVQDDQPAAVAYEQDGKIWNDTDDLRHYFWDASVGAWVSFTASGPSGVQGDFGPPGKVIVGDNPPTQYPAVGSNTARSLESGDLWFDSYRAIMYVYYVDEQSAQWVAVSKSGPKGDKGDTGNPGFADVPNDGVLYGRKDAAWEAVPAAFSGNYNDLTNQPTIPTVGDGTITLKQGGTTKGTFTVNQSGNTEINLDATTGGGGGFSGNYNDLSNKPTIPDSISDLTDVDTSSSGHVPSNGQALVWNQSMSHWMPGTVSGSGGGTLVADGGNFASGTSLVSTSTTYDGGSFD